ncbi:MAG TPA: PKD domain-containing protein [Candidatus Deferrimicrobium sp.]|nr:PKD domain-containing protein [Candidatus Deferrimicrobium sp.]
MTPVIYKEAPISSAAAASIPNNPDVAVTTATNTTQSENSIFVSPTNPQILLNSNNSSNWPVSVIYGADYWVSTDGGATWAGSTAGAGGTNKGDPATAIDLNGRMYVGYISASGGMGVSYSTNNGSTWTARTVSSKGSLDKNHLWVDNSASAFSGRLYDAWTNFLTGDPNINDIEFSRSADGGVTWSAAINLSNAVAAGSHNQGVNIQTGPNGEVYVAWSIYDCWPCNEVALGFTKSLDGGVTWSTATRIRTINGTRITTLGGSKTMRHNSYPSMSVNQQTGRIYMVWTNIGVPGTGTGDFEIYSISSTDGGSTWSTPVRVNQDTQGNGKDQWFPWIACDPVTGDVSCIFYDSRNFVSNNAAETFVAVSQDNGATWTDAKVSDFSWSGDGIIGFAGNYAGDYLGISARNGNVVPCWGDDHSGNFLTYVSPFTLTSGPTPPVAQFVGSPTSGCAPLTVNFTDQSTGFPTSWAWDFGDGGTSTAQNPSHTYTTAGSFTVTLTATNTAGSDSEIKTNYITVTSGAPTADFSGVPTSGTAPLAVNFTDLSTGGPSSWAWTFGDGGSSTLQNPSHTYTTAGTFDVTLTATNACGSNLNTKTGYITVAAPPQQCDDFADGDISNWLNKLGTWTATGGYMKGSSNTTNARTTSPFGSYSTATIDVDVRMNTGRNQRNARVVFGYVDGSNYRFVEGDDVNNRWRIYERVSGSNIVRLTVNQTVNTAQWYHVQVVAASNGLVTMKVDGVTLGSYQFAAAQNGLVGCGFTKSNSDFDNFCVGASAGAAPFVSEDEPLARPATVPDEFALRQNYPNPFNPTTTIEFSLPGASDWTLAIFNVLGQEVKRFAGHGDAGTQTVTWDASDQASGVYLYRLVAGELAATRKMMLLK